MPARPPIDAALIVQAYDCPPPIPGAGLPGNSYSKREVDIGRIAQTWELIGNSFAVLKADRELLWLPVFSGIFCLLISVAILGGAGLLFLPPVDVAAALKHRSLSQGMWMCLFLFYLANYFVIVFFNVALVSAASSRLAGGQATINDGLEVAWQRKSKIFQWALLSATVGILLRMIEERASWLGRLVGGLMGMAWTLASYFVVPVLAAENVGPAEALQRSADLFRNTWGEKVVGGFSFGLIFTLLALPGAAFPFMGRRLGPSGIAAGAALAVLYWLLLAIVNAAVQGIFVAALYRYARTRDVSAGFRLQDFSMAWQPKS